MNLQEYLALSVIAITWGLALTILMLPLNHILRRMFKPPIGYKSDSVSEHIMGFTMCWVVVFSVNEFSGIGAQVIIVMTIYVMYHALFRPMIAWFSV